MGQMLVTVRYRVQGDHAHFRHDVKKAAGLIAGIPGLVWKIWGIDEDGDTGVSAYLFASEASARAFIAGPTIERLRSRPDVTDVSFEFAPVDQELSEMTGAADALAGTPVAAAL
jgi:putative monooxygenase ydhR